MGYEADRFDWIFDHSTDYEKSFLEQDDMVKKIEEIYLKTECFANATAEEIAIVARILTDVTFAIDYYENGFPIVEYGKELETHVFLTNQALVDFCSKNKCDVVYFNFDDLLYIMKYFQIYGVTMILGENSIYFGDNLLAFRDNEYYENVLPDTDYILGSPSESYNEVQKEVIEELKKYYWIKNIWLYQIWRQGVELCPVFVVDIPNDRYIFVRNYLDSVVQRINKHGIEVALIESELGETINPDNEHLFFSNEK